MGIRQSRRSFLKSMAGAGAGFGATLVLSDIAAGNTPVAPATGKVPQRPFGKSGFQVSALSLGGIINFESNQLLLHQALKYGINYWDTADSYMGGKSETGIGKYLSRRPGVRESLFIATKSEARSTMIMDIALNASLKNLKTDYVDLYLMHMVRYSKEWQRQEVAQWAEKAKREGKIRLFGFSAHSNMVDQLNRAAEVDWIDGIMFTYNYRIMDMPEMVSAVQACHESGIGLTAMKTMGGGPGGSIPPADERLSDHFMKRGFTEYQAKLRAVWEDRRIASICSQMPNTTILSANTAAAMDRTRFSAGDRHALSRHAHAVDCRGFIPKNCHGFLPS